MNSVPTTSLRFPSFQQWSPLGALASGIFIIDLLMPLGVAAGVLYLAVVLLSLRYRDSQLPLWTAVGCSILTILALFISPVGGEFWKVLVNRGLALFAIWTTTLIGRVQLQQANTTQRSLLLTDRVFMASSDHLSILGQDYRYRRVNPSYEKVHGKDSQEVVGMSVSELLGNEVFNQTVKPMLDKCFQGHEVHYEAWFRFADDQDHYMTVSYLPLIAENNDIEEIVVIARDMTERKRMEEAAQANQRQLRTILDATTNFVCISSVEGIVTDCNQPPLDMAGLTRKDVIGKYFLDTYWLNYSPKTQKQVRGIMQRVSQGEIIREDYEARMGENLIVTIEACFVPVKDANGQVQQIVHSGIDVTQRRQAEDALQQSEDQYRDLYESAPLAYFSTSLDGHITRVNGRTSELLGYSQKELIGKHVLTLYAPTNNGHVKASTVQKKTQEGLSTQDKELQMVKKDGSVLWVNLTIRLIVDKSEKIIERRGIVQDISARKKSEGELRASEYRFRSLVETAGSIIVELTPDGQIVEWNREAERLYGKTREEVLDLNYVETFIQEEGRWPLMADVKKVLEGTPTRDVQHTVMDGNGETHQILWNVDCLLDESQQPYGVICIGRDLTKWNKAQDQLQKWATIYQHTQWGVAVGNADSQSLEMVNEAYATMHGYTVEELQGQPIPKGFATEFQTQLPEIIQVMQDRGFHSFEAPRIRKDGTSFPALLTVSAIKDQSGAMLYEVTNVIDISELKHVEAALKKSEEDRRSMALDASSSGTWDWNIQTGEVIIGGTWLKSLGYQPEDFPATVNDWKEIVHPDDFPQAKKEMARHFAKKIPVYESINRIRQKNGEWRWNLDRGRVVEWTNEGKPLRMVGTDTDITVRMEAEEALKNSELRFRTYFETGLVGMAITSLDKGWLEVNDRLCTILGYSRKELQGKTWAELTYPDDLLPDETEFNKLLAGTQNSYSMSKRFFHKDGSLLCANIYVHAVRKSSGEIDYFTAMIEDMTEQKQSETLLMKWAMIFQHTQWGVAVSKGSSNTFEMVNAAYARMHGYAIQAMEGMSITQVFSQEFRPQLPKIIEQVHQDGFLSFEAPHVRKDGTTFPALVTVSAIKDLNGQILYQVANVIDLSDLKQTEDALKKSEERFRTFFEAGLVGMGMISLEQQWLEVNDQLCELLGYPQEELKQKTWSEITYPDDLVQDQTNFESMQTGTLSSYATSKRFIRKDGSLMYGNLYINAVRKPSGQIDYFTAMVEDITEQKTLEEAIRKHNEALELTVAQRTSRIQELDQRRMQVEKLAALSQIAAGVAHEINNPLASISQSLLLLKRAIPADHPYYRYMAKTEDCIQRIALITKNLYQLYRPSGPILVPVDIRICIRTATEIMEEHALKHRLRIQTPSLPKPIMTQVSHGELIQVLCNLLHNAIDASSEEGTIEISLTTGPKSLTLLVADHGEGIPPEATPHIFEPFYTTKQDRSEGGMGLGLSISHSLVESMGGSLDFSTSLGQGSTFTITLPLT